MFAKPKKVWIVDTEGQKPMILSEYITVTQAKGVARHGGFPEGLAPATLEATIHTRALLPAHVCAPSIQEDSHRFAHEHADLAIASGTRLDMQTRAVTTGTPHVHIIGKRPQMYTCPCACVHARTWGIGATSLWTTRRPSSSS